MNNIPDIISSYNDISAEIELSNNNIVGIQNINWDLSTHYIIYELLNKENNHYYIGQHTTNNPLDRYMGSGYLLKKAKRKYGISSFIKIILFDYDNFDDMNEAEKTLVPLSSCNMSNQMCYNLQTGGNPNDLIIFREKRRLTYSNWSTERKMEMKERNRIHSKNMWKNKEISERILKSIHERAHDKKWLEKMSQVTSGKNNGMYGKRLRDCMDEDKYQEWLKTTQNRCYVNDGKKNKKIYLHELEKYQKLGYVSGILRDKRHWMTNGIENKMVLEKDKDKYESNGYVIGRTV